MIPKKNINQELFNDGILDILEVDNRTITKTLVSNIHFGNKTVGITRSHQVSIVGKKISRLICVPFNKLIQQDQVVEIETEQYSIYQIQEKYDTFPPSMYLTLIKNGVPYVDKRK